MHANIDYERLYRDAIPSVVSVYVSRGTPGVGAGSGFVYDEAHAVTNAHVVGGDGEAELRFSDGQWRRGEVVGVDAYTDLAAIHVPDLPDAARPLPVAAENPVPGRPVAALGNPLGLDGSITAGIVSGSNRSMHTSNGFAIPDVVQTDAPINPGNSGGPLVGLTPDGEGYEVVGVNRAKSGDNIGFAVSPAIVTRVVPSLIATGRYRHAYLRARTLDVTPTVAEANGLAEPRGILVVDVVDGPAAGDALRGCTGTRTVRGREVPVGGDVILGINGQALHTHEQLMGYLITETRPGEPADVDVVRDGEVRTLSVTLRERPAVETRRRGRRGRYGRDPRAPRARPDGRGHGGGRRSDGGRGGRSGGGRDRRSGGDSDGRGTNVPIR